MYNNARITRRGSHIQGRRVRSLAGRFRTLKTTTIKQMMTYYFFPLFLQRYVFHHLSPPVASPLSLYLSHALRLSLTPPLSLYHPYILSNQIVYNIPSLPYIIHCSTVLFRVQGIHLCPAPLLKSSSVLCCTRTWLFRHAVVHLCDVTYFIMTHPPIKKMVHTPFSQPPITWSFRFSA